VGGRDTGWTAQEAGGGKIDIGGWRGLGCRGYRMAIVFQNHVLFTVGGG